MPWIDIATAQPGLQKHLVPVRPQTLIRGQVISSSWKSPKFPTRIDFHVSHPPRRGGILQVRAVATLEPKCSVQKEDRYDDSQMVARVSSSTSQPGSPKKNEEELDERERLRRMRISKANRGNTPWNKGRKHSAETLQRIRERTKLAMQNPKVKMKLVNLGHAQSEETRVKIGIGVREGWRRRRERSILQEACHFEWQNLIAEASRRGYIGQEELQWDSYKVLDEQLTKEWLESVEQRKTMPRPKGSKRAPKSLEQRRKIAAAIAAKWADPDYRVRVYSGLAKYHGSVVGESKPKRKPSVDTARKKRNPSKRKAGDANNDTMSPVERMRLRRKNKPLYKDPLANSKLEMIKSIRAERAAADSKKTEAVERARLLIAEAEKAAKALEVAATRSPIAHASLMETRKLIAEAIQSIESIEEQVTFSENDSYLSSDITEVLNQFETERKLEDHALNEADQVDVNGEVNGKRSLSLSRDMDFNFANFTLQTIVNGDEQLVPLSTNIHHSPTFDLGSLIEHSNSSKQVDKVKPNGMIIQENNSLPNGVKVGLHEDHLPSEPVTVTKKWVRGRLVEVTEGAS